MMNKRLRVYKHHFGQHETRALMGGGAVLCWLAKGKDTNGQFSLFEAKGIPGMEPPPHTHANEDETYYLLEGEMWFRVGDEEFIGTPGDFVFLPRNIQHEFKVLTERFRCLVGIYPAGLEDYFEHLSVPHPTADIPPLSTEPPPPAAMEMMAKLDAQFGISYSM